MAEIQIKSLTERDFRGLHECLYAVSRERKYLGLVEAPPQESTLDRLHKSQDRAYIRLVALDGERVVGWSDVERKTQEGFTHRGVWGWVCWRNTAARASVPSCLNRRSR